MSGNSRNPAEFGRARDKVRSVLAAVGSANPPPYMDCWARSADATLPSDRPRRKAA
jgi:hypothetical protein